MSEPQLTEQEARGLARETWKQHNTPVLDYPFPDTIGDSYSATRLANGWQFSPAVAGLDRNPRLASTFPHYLVNDQGEVRRVPYGDGPPERA